MRSTTIRIDEQTHAELVRLATARGDSLVDTVREAATALRRQRFAEQVAQELQALRSDPKAWAAYIAESEATTVRDGIA